MADRALQYFTQMVNDGVKPDAQTYRRLFKCLKQACRYQQIVNISASLPRELIVRNDRIGMPVINSCLRVKDQARALDLLSDLVLKPNTSYDTLRWATSIYCTKVSKEGYAGPLMDQSMTDTHSNTNVIVCMVYIYTMIGGPS